jgi:hypothetical protein
MEAELKRPKLESDAVIRYLVDVNLIEHERTFRVVLANIKSPPVPSARELVIATVIVLMRIGAVDPDTINVVQAALADRPAAQLREEAVAIVNGQHLLLPGDRGRIKVINMATLREEQGDPPSAWVSTIYSLAAIWERAEKLGA